ncbi:MAG: hypothetical protein QXU11_07585 [Thermoproteota archaeon]
MNRRILPIEEPELKPLANLQARDIVLLITVIMGVKPIATLVVPLEVRGWFQRFCERSARYLKDHVESRLLLPRFYQTGGARFVDLQPIDYDQHKEELSVSRKQFEDDARSRLPEPIEIVLCNIPRPYVLVEAPEEPPYKTAFPNPDMIGTMWLAYTPGFGAYMVNAKT